MAAIGSVGSSDYAYQSQTVSNSNQTSESTDNKVESKTDSNSNSAAVYEQTISEEDKKAAAQKRVQELIKESEEKAAQFQKMLMSILDKQGKNSAISIPDSNLKQFYQNLTVSDEDRKKAQEDISEDGYYGVKKTTERIMDMAKALAGNDPAMISKMREAVEKGFGEAKKAWGDELPDISKQTYNKVMEEFDEWEKSVSASGTPSVAATSAGK